jgi:hypothetical protein
MFCVFVQRSHCLTSQIELRKPLPPWKKPTAPWVCGHPCGRLCPAVYAWLLCCAVDASAEEDGERASSPDSEPEDDGTHTLVNPTTQKRYKGVSTVVRTECRHYSH